MQKYSIKISLKQITINKISSENLRITILESLPNVFIEITTIHGYPSCSSPSQLQVSYSISPY